MTATEAKARYAIIKADPVLYANRLSKQAYRKKLRYCLEPGFREKVIDCNKRYLNRRRNANVDHT